MATVKKNVSGFVFKEDDFRNTSKIVQIYTDKLGRISVMARGSYRKNSPLASLTRAYSLVSLDLTKGRNFYYIREGELVSANQFVASSMALSVMVQLVSEILLRTTAEEERDENTFLLVKAFIEALEKKKDLSRDLASSFLIKYASFQGFRPRFESCICGEKKTIAFSLSQGGMVCSRCLEMAINLETDEVLALNQLLYRPFLEIGGLKASQSKKLFNLCLQYIKYSFSIEKFNIESWIKRVF